MTALSVITPAVSASDYQTFIASKLKMHVPVGFSPSDLSGYGLFDFQAAIVEWAVKRGRAAIFADTGLGKTRMQLWSNPGDLVLSPFAGIGSEGFVALQMGRRFIGAELKRSYFEVACRNLAAAKSTQGLLLNDAHEIMEPA
jgi:hypothetical protein